MFKSVLCASVSRAQFITNRLQRSFEFLFRVFNSCDNCGLQIDNPVNEAGARRCLLDRCNVTRHGSVFGTGCYPFDVRDCVKASLPPRRNIFRSCPHIAGSPTACARQTSPAACPQSIPQSAARAATALRLHRRSANGTLRPIEVDRTSRRSRNPTSAEIGAVSYLRCFQTRL